jgi:hypothetical protein
VDVDAIASRVRQEFSEREKAKRAKKPNKRALQQKARKSA